MRIIKPLGELLTVGLIAFVPMIPAMAWASGSVAGALAELALLPGGFAAVFYGARFKGRSRELAYLLAASCAVSWLVILISAYETLE